MRGRIGGNSSRPASLHVDDFEKAASSMPTPPLASATLMATPSPSMAPPLSTIPNKSGSITPRDSGAAELDTSVFCLLQRLQAAHFGTHSMCHTQHLVLNRGLMQLTVAQKHMTLFM